MRLVMLGHDQKLIPNWISVNGNLGIIFLVALGVPEQPGLHRVSGDGVQLKSLFRHPVGAPKWAAFGLPSQEQATLSGLIDLNLD